ncbi:uncharacterized protein LOC112047856 [Bicyclus anynana]|uniref:Uncharacterized protein LOC112047856 n=1 Tax=Bicyclus anynana TaxID=110368 RepID=A0A6J1N784_BICAN|nr:uncharacterized protein LOC112047856 [Bicyclus anynana]
MAKFIKSFFSADRRRSRNEECEEDKNIALSLDGRRKLSLSRSGRMKQANRKRQSLSLDVYNHDIQMSEKPKTTEIQTAQRKSVIEENKTENVRRSLNAEEEIDTAFEIINKTIITDL